MEAPTHDAVRSGTPGLWIDRAAREHARMLAALRGASLRTDGALLLGDLAEEGARDIVGWERETTENVWLLAALDGRAVGLTRLGRYDDEEPAWHLEALWVRPENRHEGIGTGLVRRAEAYVAGLGEPALGLWVMDGNRAAQSFFAALGYRVRRPGLLADGRTEHEYTKALDMIFTGVAEPASSVV